MSAGGDMALTERSGGARFTVQQAFDLFLAALWAHLRATGRGALRNLSLGLCLITFRSLRMQDLSVSGVQLLLLFAAHVGIAIGLDYVDTAPLRYFWSYGFLWHGTWFLICVCVAFALTGGLGLRGMPGFCFLTLMLASQVWIFALVGGLGLIPDAGSWWRLGPFFLGVSWLLVAAVRGLWLVSGPPLWGRMILGVVFVLIVEGAGIALPNIRYWYSLGEDTAEVEERVEVDTEAVYYAQPALLADAKAALSRGRPGYVDLYFVGFANYGAQDVFMKEVNFARSLFDDRFGTEGRSTVLINNQQTSDKLPLANEPNLRAVLAMVAQKMNLKEDVLFLFLTSHGSKDATLAANFWPLAPKDLTATALRAALDDAGIGWRVLVISACYAGSFVDALSDDRTLVLTAAARDRTSFGCSDERELTYFGEHYFSQELSQSDSFVDAFNRAKETLRAREIREGQKPSNPQMFIGEKMGRKLDQIQSQLARTR